MTLNNYQKLAMATCVIEDKTDLLHYGILNTASEGGELAGKWAKAIRKGVPMQDQDLIAEAGDVLWSLAAIAEGLGVTLEDIANYNIKKLADRMKRDVIHGDGDNR